MSSVSFTVPAALHSRLPRQDLVALRRCINEANPRSERDVRVIGAGNQTIRGLGGQVCWIRRVRGRSRARRWRDTDRLRQVFVLGKWLHFSSNSAKMSHSSIFLSRVCSQKAPLFMHSPDCVNGKQVKWLGPSHTLYQLIINQGCWCSNGASGGVYWVQMSTFCQGQRPHLLILELIPQVDVKAFTSSPQYTFCSTPPPSGTACVYLKWK